ncbi:hypothetical protein FRB90_011109 [Tulasnella sp. 427]|nr:hypothetical protein FRB90_011109 [Tulasnella sp. 427]
MLQTPSMNRSLRPNHVAATPTRSSQYHLPAPVLLDSPPQKPLFTTPHTVSRNYTASKVDDRAAFSSDPNTSDADDQYDDEDAFFDDEAEVALDGSPTTPAPRKAKSCLSLADLSVARRHRPGSAKVPTSGDRIAPPQFGTTPRVVPQTPHNADDEWRNHAGAESMTRLSIDDCWKSSTGSLSAWSGKSVSGTDRKRTNTSSYKPSRYNKSGSPKHLIDRSDSPTSKEAAALFQSGGLFASRISKSPEAITPMSPFSNSARFPSLQLAMGTLSQETAARPEPSSPELFPPLPNLAGSSSPFAPLPVLESFKRAPSPSRSNMSLSTSASTASNTSYSSPSLDRLNALSDVSNAPRIARKFKGRPRKSSAAGTDDSDGGVGDISFGSTSSLSRSNNNKISPLVVDLADEEPFNLVTPSFVPSPAAKWPTTTKAPAPRSGLSRSDSIDPDEMLFHLARAEEVEAANAKPVMPDTPIKRHPAKPRTWASTGKNWGVGTRKDSAFLGAPRKSLPLQLFGAIPDSPDSADSDPSPSKIGKRPLSRPSMPPRRRSAGPLSLRGSFGPEPSSPVRALPLKGATSSPDNPLENHMPRSLRRTNLLTVSRTASSQSIGSDISTDDSHTPTKRGTLPAAWKTPALAVHAIDSVDPLDVGLTPSKGAFGFPPPSPGQRAMPPPPTPIAKRPSLTTIAGSPSDNPSLQAWSNRVNSRIERDTEAGGDVARKPGVPHRLQHHGSVKSFFKARPSLQTTSTPLRSSLRRESNPSKPVAAVGWGTPIASTSVAGSRSSLPLFTGSAEGTRPRLGEHKDNPLFFGVAASPPALRRPRSSSRVPLLRDHRSPDTNDHIVQERPGHFERDFEKDGGGILGKGTFGQVFKVKKRGSDTVFAVKRSKPYEGARHRARLMEEVDVLRHLTLANGNTQSTPSTHRITQGHDNVLHFIDAWEQDGTLYIQTELCELGSLETYLAGYGKIHDRLDESRLWKILSEVANGLLHVHRCGVLHLDLKPSNIFVTDEGRLRIGDFGMATRWPRSEAQTKDGGGFEREGDREYLAAEILVGVYGPAADIFSFGMIMLEAAGNIVVPSFGEMWHALRNDDFSAVCLDGFSFVLVNTIRSMMASDYTTRPSIETIISMDPVLHARAAMKRTRLDRVGSRKMFKASAFAAEGPGFLTEILGPEVVATIQPASVSSSPVDTEMDLGE